jgi:16S rRNA (uracil1498-N3)-methyltransferase
MHRFFVSPEDIAGSGVTLTGRTAAQLAQVLRSRAGDRIVVLDDSGWEYHTTLESVDPRRVTGTVTDKVRGKGEPETPIVVYQAALKADRFEYVLQKGTELGVAAFVPVFCARSIPDGSSWASKREKRWRSIVREAAEQSRRCRLPQIKPAVDFAEACDRFDGIGLVPWEGETSEGLRTALRRIKGRTIPSRVIGIFTGPEGGFTEREIEYARSSGIAPVTLGKRILRAETAPIAAVSAVLYEFGDLGG